MTGQKPEQIIGTFIGNENLTGKHLDWFLSLIDSIPIYVDEIDALIEPHLDRSSERVDPIEQAILRLGAFELRFDPTVPTNVVIDEAIDLAKTFGSEQGYRYVNGVLDKVARAVRD